MIQQARHMVDSTTRLYSIKVKDAETGTTLNFTAADWSGDDKRLAVTEKRLAMAIISRLTAQRLASGGLGRAAHNGRPVPFR
jgi:hypothetical protein